MEKNHIYFVKCKIRPPTVGSTVRGLYLTLRRSSSSQILMNANRSSKVATADVSNLLSPNQRRR